MKKILFIAIATVLLSSCLKEYTDTSFTPSTPFITVNTESLLVNSNDTTVTVNLTSNLPWMAEYDAAWYSVSPTRGDTGATLTIVIKKNKYTEDRTSSLKLKITDSDFTLLPIRQKANSKTGVTFYYVKVDGKEDNSGLSWTTATTFETAMSKAMPGDSILVAAGTYTPAKYLTGTAGYGKDENKTFEILENVTVMGGFPKDANDDTTLEDYDPSTNLTYLNGAIGGSRTYHVVTVTAEKRDDAKASLLGFNINGGCCQSFSAKEDAMKTGYSVNGKLIKTGYGGGVYVSESTVDLIDCNINGNESGYYAGGCYMMPKSVVTMKSCQISGNSAVNNAGGIWNTHATLTMYECTVSGNSTSGQAGGLYVSQFNTDKNEDNTPSVCRIYNSTFFGNTTPASLTEKRSGGACYVRATGDVVFVNCTFYGNSSYYGAGVEVYGNNNKFNSKTALFNCTITGNTAMERGGGVCLFNDYATLDLYNCLVSGNTSGFAEDPSNTDIGYGSSVKDVTHLQYYNSLVGSSLYTERGYPVSGWTFDALTMLSSFGYHSTTGGKTQTLVPLLSADNPAVDQGLSETELIKKAEGFDPAIDLTVFAKDQNLQVRSANYIGSCLAQ